MMSEQSEVGTVGAWTSVKTRLSFVRRGRTEHFVKGVKGGNSFIL